jgi:amino acid transporter
MLVNLVINKKISIILVVLISGGLWFYSAFAQDANATSGLGRPGLEEKLSAFDHLLNIGISAPLTALSLTGATFLTRINKSDSEDPTYTQLMHSAKKHLIIAFVVFLACTISIFVFDFLELLLPNSLLVVAIIDLVISYSLLFTGFGYLSLAAQKMYLTQVK